METWYLIIVLVIGNYNTMHSSQQTIEFASEDACITVMETLTEKYDSSNNTIICVKDR